MASVVIGVAGGSGSGKTTVVRRLLEGLGHDTVSVLEHDRYYHDQSGRCLEERAHLNFDHPDALDTALLIEHLRLLRAGAPAEAPTYDFARHARRLGVWPILPRPAVIVEGILVLADSALRDLLDVKVFVDVDDETRLRRRLERDTVERGRSPASVLDQFEATVRPMHQRFVEPSRQFADVIITDGGFNRPAIDRLLELIRTRIPAL